MGAPNCAEPGGPLPTASAVKLTTGTSRACVRFVAGTIVVFDEYFGYHGWQRHEHKAFQEFLSRTGLSFEAIGLGHMNLAVRLING